jgi:hypothetical protein
VTPLDDLDAQLGIKKETPEELLIAGLETEDKIPETEVQDNE